MRREDAPRVSKRLRFAKAAYDEMKAMPAPIQRRFGFALRFVQDGLTPDHVTPFEGSTGANIMKIEERYNTDTYRCVYAAKFENVIYVLHVFQKKSKSGIATPKPIIDLVHSRYRAAKEDCESDDPNAEREEREI